jgi:hypothetical protein
MSANSLGSLAKQPGVGWALLGVVAIVGFVVVKNAIAQVAKATGDTLGKAADAAGAAATTVGKYTVDAAGDFATGNTQAAHGTPYEGKGIIASLAADTDALFGGGLSTFGGWLGGTVYDAFHPTDDAGATSNQGANNNPFGGGNSAWYGDAVDSSPVNATWAASPFTDTALATPPDYTPPVPFNPGAGASGGW